METNRRTLSLAVARRRSHLWWLLAALTLAIGGVLVKPAAAQQPPADTILTPAQLQDLVGPIALYPDDLVGIVLPASTYPLQVVEAERFIDKRKQDPNSKPNEDWDDSVVALLNYPEVVHLLSDDLEWTWDLGTAVLNQRADVLDAIQSFRTRARGAGNLRTDNRQTVTTQTDGSIAIAPADPQVIYVPYYEPERVVVYQQEPVYSYYPWAYPVYYYPYPIGYRFSTGFWGVTSYFSIGWHSHLLHVRYWGHDDFPYFGWDYYAPYYARNYINVNINVPRGGYVWEPRHRYGDRPSVPIVRGRDGRVADSRPEPRGGNGGAGSASRYRNRGGANSASATPATSPRPGANEGSTYRYREPTATRGPNATAPRPNGEGGSAARSERTNPAPQFESRDGTAAPRYRIPTAPERQPQTASPSPREDRGTNTFSRYAAPQVRSAPPRAESSAAAASPGEVRSAPRSEGGSSRSGGGERAPQHHSGGNRSDRSGDGRGGESRSR